MYQDGFAAKNFLKYLHDNHERTQIYTVDDISEQLNVPRPTLYRYLREYSIPYTRRSGRISIPEESIQRIRTVRELHDEGLGTEAVRRRLREGDGSDVDWIAERLDRLSKALEGSQSNLKPTEDISSAQALRIILARQSLLISSIFNLTEMMEELLAAAGRPRRASSDYLEEEIQRDVLDDPASFAENTVQTDDTLDTIPVTQRAAHDSVRRRVEAVALSAGSDRFGALARRRRRMAVGVMVALSVCGVLAVVFIFGSGLPFW